MMQVIFSVVSGSATSTDHLLFAKNYFKKVSGGKQEVTYKVLPEVITVSKMMREYSPGYNSSDLTPIADFSKEVWTLADQKFPKEVFSKYNLFIIFHAGVSSGLDLGTFSIDRNMPSIYIGLNTLKKMFGASFTGFPTRTGNITNSIILPETESREQELVTGDVYLNQISINGGIVNNIGNHLGLPDLFNTETGTSAIGRFGMMDGQAISANYGMFPPEPSPWERMYLGWETPKVYSGGTAKINITTRATAVFQDTTLLKIPINSSEYFLVENRQQDAKKDYLKLTISKSGKIFTKIFQPDTSGLYYVSPSDVKGGVVIDVDEFDASAPGSGIVIWHIDDKIINAKIADNKINADPDNKGVYVVEADGIQDVGNTYESIFGTVIEDGYPQDFWFKGNKAKYYTKKFGTDSKPSTKSNSGASTFLTLENFSSLSNKMSFNISMGGVSLNKIGIKIQNTAKTLSMLNTGTTTFLYVTDSDKSLYKFDLNGTKLFTYSDFSQLKPAVTYYKNTEIVVGVSAQKLNIYFKQGNNELVRTILYSYAITCPPVIAYTNGTPMLYFGTTGILYTISLKDFVEANFSGNDSSVTFGNDFIKQIGAVDDYYALINHLTFYDSKKTSIKFSSSTIQLSLSKSSSGIISSIVLLEKNDFVVIRNGNILSRFTIKSVNSIKSFSLGAVDNSGENSILVYNGNSLEAYNLNGKLVDGFPITLGTKPFSFSPLTINMDSEKTYETASINSEGNLYFANRTGKLTQFGESVNIGTNGNVLLSMFNSGQSSSLAALDETNNLSIWNFVTPSGIPGWTNLYGDDTNSSSAVAVSTSAYTTEYFPASKAYNWPNPVYGTSTNIRYYVSESSKVTIKIFDLAGALVTTLYDNAIGGMDNETIWNVGNIQSGIYYTNLEVNGSSGQTANKIIKIAVIK